MLQFFQNLTPQRFTKVKHLLLKVFSIFLEAFLAIFGIPRFDLINLSLRMTKKSSAGKKKAQVTFRLNNFQNLKFFNSIIFLIVLNNGIIQSGPSYITFSLHIEIQ